MMRLGLGVIGLPPEIFWNLESNEWQATCEGWLMRDAKETERARTIAHFISALGGKPVPRHDIFPVWYDNLPKDVDIQDFKERQRELIEQAARMNMMQAK
ncbi:phage tail assembly chaperone [Candidatus Parvarchaeota archaeon]|nr:phage tail assembly chaperone [Candidatus Parvarchaeota archaeon]